MKNGFKIWDADTHIHPTIEVVEPYYDPDIRARLPELERYKVPVRAGDGARNPRQVAGRHHYSIGRVAYRRILGQATLPAVPVVNAGKFRGTKPPSVGVTDDDVDARIRDMDEEGVDVHLMVPGVPMGVSLLKDPALEMGLIRAYHRYVNDFCGKYPDRLKALLVVTGTAVEASVREIKAWGKSRWAVGVWPFPGMDKPLDHPDLEPIWAAVEDEGLAVVHHSLTWDPPYFPGYRDLDDNLFLGRLCAHPWGAMKAVGSFIGSGIMDRYPNIRFGILECGCGWLPFWARRMDDQAEYVGATAKLEYKLSDYMTSGRFFSSIEMHEGEDMIKMVMDFLGDGVLMYASDYPHPECMFPKSPDHALAWKSPSQAQMHKLMWDNAVRFYGQP
jgi:uncharacterized protein